MAASGTCEIRTRKGDYPINILGNHNEEYITSEFGQSLEGTRLNAWLNLKDNGNEGFGTKLSKIFGKKTMDTEKLLEHLFYRITSPITLTLITG